MRIIDEKEVRRADFRGVDFVFAVARGERLRGINIGRPRNNRVIQLFLREGSDVVLVEVDDIENVYRVNQLRYYVKLRRVQNGMSSSMSARLDPP